VNPVKNQFGIPGIEKAVSNEKDILKPNNGKISKAKIDYFINDLIKKKSLIPGPRLSPDNWDENSSSGYKFSKTKKITLFEEMYLKSKKKETSVPGPTDYKSDCWKKKSSLKSMKAAYNLKAPVITYAEEEGGKGVNSPFLKYD
jgi:hypothetical protein